MAPNKHNTKKTTTFPKRQTHTHTHTNKQTKPQKRVPFGRQNTIMFPNQGLHSSVTNEGGAESSSKERTEAFAAV